MVFGLVGPTGVDLTIVCDALQAHLTSVRYEPFVVNLSKLIPRIAKPNKFDPANEYDRIKSLMKMGTKLREDTGQADIVARLGIAEIRALREVRNNNPLKPIPRAAYIVRSFKRPEEVELYRTIYGKAFTLISVYSPRDARVKHIRRKFSQIAGVSRTADELAAELINRDYAEEGGKKYGQSVSETFPLADYFLTTDSKMVVEENIRRLIYLIFGDPYISPTRDEQGMFFAQASALRSLDLSRQVGAAIISRDGDLLSTGCNEVPKYGGGLYWGEDANRKRDVELGHDTNVAIKREIVEDTFSHLRKAGWLSEKAKKKTTRFLRMKVCLLRKHFCEDRSYLMLLNLVALFMPRWPRLLRQLETEYLCPEIDCSARHFHVIYVRAILFRADCRKLFSSSLTRKVGQKICTMIQSPSSHLSHRQPSPTFALSWALLLGVI
ncbi:putative cytidine deaminase [Burkholderia pseudomallei]|nr:putative cytidine deaminase [Burkholderia pseudomallei]